MVKMSKAKRQDKATMTSSNSRRSASEASATRASANKSSKVSSRRSKPTLHSARVFVATSRATSIVWCDAAPGGGAYHSCVAVRQRRLRHDASDVPWSIRRGGIRNSSTRLGRSGASSHAGHADLAAAAAVAAAAFARFF